MTEKINIVRTYRLTIQEHRGPALCFTLRTDMDINQLKSAISKNVEILPQRFSDGFLIYTLKKSMKPRHCSGEGCSQMINPGESYYVFGKISGWTYPWPICLECAKKEMKKLHYEGRLTVFEAKRIGPVSLKNRLPSLTQQP
jgi:hypothetical protein